MVAESAHKSVAVQFDFIFDPDYNLASSLNPFILALLREALLAKEFNLKFKHLHKA